MTTKREALLSLVRAACATGRFPDGGADRPARLNAELPIADSEGLAARFSREIDALSGHLHFVETSHGLVDVVLGILRAHECNEVLAWDADALPGPWLPVALERAGVAVRRGTLAVEPEARRRELADLARIGAGLTGARAALADTGSLVLAHGPGCGRLASLLPPVHVALVSRRVLYPSLAAFLAVEPHAVSESSNLVIVTGPSRTADIEMTLTHGVHGPRELHVVLVP
jgi:L-lactate dehydrogenase complex protein LldG